MLEPKGGKFVPPPLFSGRETEAHGGPWPRWHSRSHCSSLHRLPAPPPASSPPLSCLLTHFAGGAPNEPQPLFAVIFCNWTSRPFRPLLHHPELVQNLHVFDPYVSSGCFTVWVQEPGQREGPGKPLALEEGEWHPPADPAASQPRDPALSGCLLQDQVFPGWGVRLT